MIIRFLGGVKGVTGSCHLIEFKGKKILLDCGMFQGRDEDLNLQELEVNPAEVDYLFLSHSHIDHSGRIPLLVKRGFKGIIYSTKPAFDLCQIMLVDSAHIQETEAEWKNKKAKRTGRNLVEPMYTQQDALDSFKYFMPVLYEQIVDVNENLTICFKDAGHILGSAIVEMWFKDEQGTVKLVFSGDLGMDGEPLLKDPTVIEKADYLIMEATYGNRLHQNVKQRTDELIEIILKTIKRGGNVIIPSFAVGRTQQLIYELNKYYDQKCKGCGRENELSKIPVYIDSPLATKATEIFKENANVFDEEAKDLLMNGDNPLQFDNLHFTHSAEESKELNLSKEPKVIISASGMCEAGRIKHHLKHNLWRKESSIVFVGYQAEGTLGRKIVEGEKNVKVLGEEIYVKAEVYNLEGFSGHADKDALMKWLKGFKEKPKKVFIVHGEGQSKEDFAAQARKELSLNCIVPVYGNIYPIKTEADEEEIDEIKVLRDEESEALNVKKDEMSQNLIAETERLRNVFAEAINAAEKNINKESVDYDTYKKIKNNILEIEQNILNLTSISINDK